MTIDEAVAIINDAPEGDPEVAHSIADDVLLELVDPRVADAYRALIKRCRWWACA